MAELRLALAGPMGAGKSTVGRMFAARQRVAFTDLDAEIGDIPSIWAVEGEEGFRARERAVLLELARGAGVLALGGGTLVDPHNRAALAGWKIVVLTADLGVLRARIGAGVGRPLAADLERLIAERAPVWRAAGPELRTDGRTLDAVVDELEALCASQ